MTFCLFLFYILFPNNLVTNIFLPGKQGVYLENGIRPKWGYRKLQGVTRGYMGLKEVTGCYMALEGVTWGNGGLEGVTWG